MSIEKLALGCSKLGSLSGVTGEDAKRLIREAYEGGIGWYDTANIYGQGESERLLGECYRTTQGGIKITTKAGYLMSGIASSQGMNWVKPLLRKCIRMLPVLQGQVRKAREKVVMNQNFQEDYLCNSISESLERTGQKSLDEFLLHSPPEDLLLVDETFGVLRNIKKIGLAKRVGISLASPKHTRYISNESGLDLVQLELNLLSKKSEFELVRKFKKTNSAKIIVRRPFAGGGAPCF